MLHQNLFFNSICIYKKCTCDCDAVNAMFVIADFSILFLLILVFVGALFMLAAFSFYRVRENFVCVFI